MTVVDCPPGNVLDSLFNEGHPALERLLVAAIVQKNVCQPKHADGDAYRDNPSPAHGQFTAKDLRPANNHAVKVLCSSGVTEGSGRDAESDCGHARTGSHRLD